MRITAYVVAVLIKDATDRLALLPCDDIQSPAGDEDQLMPVAKLDVMS